MSRTYSFRTAENVLTAVVEPNNKLFTEKIKLKMVHFMREQLGTKQQQCDGLSFWIFKVKMFGMRDAVQTTLDRLDSKRAAARWVRECAVDGKKQKSMQFFFISISVFNVWAHAIVKVSAKSGQLTLDDEHAILHTWYHRRNETKS